MAAGYIAGEILRLGPDYLSLVGSSSKAQDWTSCWHDHYHQEEDLEALRRIDEEYAAKILDYEQTDLARIRSIHNPHVSAWRYTQNRCDVNTPGSGHATDSHHAQASMDVNNQAPRICLGTGYVMGLVPPAAILHDVIVRFWNCSAALVMRPTKTHSMTTSFMLIGRADIADIVDRTDGVPSKAQKRLSMWTSNTLPGSEKSSQCSGAVYVNLNLRTLQKITAHTTTYEDSMDTKVLC